MQFENLSNQLVEINDQFSCINAGGCGEFARILGKKLKKTYPKIKYVLITENGKSLLESQRHFNSLGKNVMNDRIRVKNEFVICHIMLYYKGKFIDSTGVYNSLNETKWVYRFDYNLGAILSQKVLNSWCKSAGTWNNMFDRDQLPEIKNCIKNLKF